MPWLQDSHFYWALLLDLLADARMPKVVSYAASGMDIDYGLLGAQPVVIKMVIPSASKPSQPLKNWWHFIQSM